MADWSPVIRRHSKSFALAARLLPPRCRRDAVLLYAWCRGCDDAVDHAPSPAEARSRIADLRGRLDDAFAGRQCDPLFVAFGRLARRTGIPKQYPSDMLDGMADDAAVPRLETEAELLRYCYQVAGTVGLMMCHVLDVGGGAAPGPACDYGTAMQLTNIARDVWEDAQRGRRYLPAEWLGGAEPGPGAVRRTLALAEEYYRRGEFGLKYLSPRCRLAVTVAGEVYRAIGSRIARRGHRIGPERVHVSKFGKLAIAGRVAAAWLAEAHRPVHPSRP